MIQASKATGRLQGSATFSWDNVLTLMICSISVVHVALNVIAMMRKAIMAVKCQSLLFHSLEELSLNAFRFKIFLSPNGSGRILSLTPIRVKANK